MEPQIGRLFSRIVVLLVYWFIFIRTRPTDIMAEKEEWNQHVRLLVFNNIGGFVETWMASTVHDKAFLVAMSRLAPNNSGTRTHIRRINVAFCQYVMGYDTIDHGLHCTLRNDLQQKLWALSRQPNKKYIGNAQYGRVKAHF
jgi:hypothetical protein